MGYWSKQINPNTNPSTPTRLSVWMFLWPKHKRVRIGTPRQLYDKYFANKIHSSSKYLNDFILMFSCIWKLKKFYMLFQPCSPIQLICIIIFWQLYGYIQNCFNRGKIMFLHIYYFINFMKPGIVWAILMRFKKLFNVP